MKDRIVKFYKDHEDEFAIATSVVATIAAVTGSIVMIKTKINDGKDIEGVWGFKDDEDNEHVIVGLKNGNSRSYFKKPQAVN
jgi:hypothetical protein